MTEVFHGKGGTEHVVDDVDFWENGDPGRKYRILGVLTEGRKRRLPLGPLTRVVSAFGNSDEESVIARAVRKHGGDAVIFVSKGREESDLGQDSDGNHRQFTLVVVKYVE